MEPDAPICCGLHKAARMDQDIDRLNDQLIALADEEQDAI
jgi:hypothetical protein